MCGMCKSHSMCWGGGVRGQGSSERFVRVRMDEWRETRWGEGQVHEAARGCVRSALWVSRLYARGMIWV